MADEDAERKMLSGEIECVAVHNSRYTADFEARYRKKPEDKQLTVICKDWFIKSCSRQAVLKSLAGNFPFVEIMRGYRVMRDLPSDVIAGMTVGIMQIPQGMAYAALASLPPICGLYTSLFAPLIYFFFASSKHASMGCIAVVSLMIAAVLETRLGAEDALSPVTLNLTSNDTFSDLDLERAINTRKIQIATALSFISGLIMMVLGKLGLGFVTTYMSEYLISGFTTGVAVHVVTSQVKNVLGLKVTMFSGVFKIIKTWIEIFRNIGDTNWVPVVTSVVSVIIIYVIKTQINERFKHRLRIPLPIELIVVIIGTVVSHFGQFQVEHNVKVVGEIPAGIPLPQIPDVSLVTSHIGDAVIIGVIAFAQSVSMAKTLAMKHQYTVNANQEMFAYGAGSVLCSIFSGYIPAASVARSVVQDGAGGITQIASVAGSLVVLVVVMAVGPLFYSLPSCVLSSVIIVNLRSMFRQILQISILWKKSKWDCSIWVVTFLCVTLLDADIGLGIGIIFSIFTVVCRTQRSGVVAKGQINSTDEFRTNKRYNQVRLLPNVKILTFEAPLYFANSELFINRTYTESGINPIEIKRNRITTVLPKNDEVENNPPSDNVPSNQDTPELENGIIQERRVLMKNGFTEPDMVYLIFDMSGVTFIDSMGAKALELTVTEFETIDVRVYIVGLREEVIDVLQCTEFMDKHRSQVYMNLADALAVTHAASTL